MGYGFESNYIPFLFINYIFMNEFEFYVKVEGYKESRQIVYADTVDEARQKISDELNKQGFMNIQYIMKM